MTNLISRLSSRAPVLRVRAGRFFRIGVVLILSAFVLAPLPAQAWGEAGHRIGGLVAARTMPAETPAFFRSASDQLSYLNPDPDRWRDRIESRLDPALNAWNAPEHYIDLERVSPQMMQARTRDEYLALAHRANMTSTDVGVLLFAILERFQRLRVEFRLWREATDPRVKSYIEQRIINDAGILGHFVTDASNPHHTTVQHNGWVGENPNNYTTDKTFHNRFESIYVETHIKPEEVRDIVSKNGARVIKDVRAEMWKYINDSHAQVETLYQIEKRATFDDKTTAAENRQFAVERLAAGAQMLRDLWWTAWMTSEITPEQRQWLEQQNAPRPPRAPRTSAPATPKQRRAIVCKLAAMRR